MFVFSNSRLKWVNWGREIITAFSQIIVWLFQNYSSDNSCIKTCWFLSTKQFAFHMSYSTVIYQYFSFNIFIKFIFHRHDNLAYLYRISVLTQFFKRICSNHSAVVISYYFNIALCLFFARHEPVPEWSHIHFLVYLLMYPKIHRNLLR